MNCEVLSKCGQLMLGVMMLAALSYADEARKDEAKPGKLQLQDQAGDITGFYECRGIEANGKPYSGMATIVRKGDVYLVSWMVGGGSSFAGVGVRQGDTFAVSWAVASQAGIVKGVNVYRIDGKKLSGRWATIPGPGALQSETLEWLKALPAEQEEGQ